MNTLENRLFKVFMDIAENPAAGLDKQLEAAREAAKVHHRRGKRKPPTKKTDTSKLLGRGTKGTTR